MRCTREMGIVPRPAASSDGVRPSEARHRSGLARSSLAAGRTRYFEQLGVPRRARGGCGGAQESRWWGLNGTALLGLGGGVCCGGGERGGAC